MIKAGCVVMVLGVLLTATSCVSCATAVSSMTSQQQVFSAPVAPDQTTVTERFKIREGLCKISIRGELEVEPLPHEVTAPPAKSEAISTTPGEATPTKNETPPKKQRRTKRYQFPVSVRVMDASGASVFSQSGHASMTQHLEVNSVEDVADLPKQIEAATSEHQVWFTTRSFEAPVDQWLTAEVAVGPDDKTLTILTDTQVAVYDHLKPSAGWVMGSLALLVIGPTFLLVGVILLVIGLALTNNTVPLPKREVSGAASNPEVADGVERRTVHERR